MKDLKQRIMARGRLFLIGFLAILFLLEACKPDREASLSHKEEGIPTGQEALYWISASNEFPSVTRVLYELAQIRVKENLTDLHLTAYPEQTGSFSHLPPAVILDLDETVLNNIPYTLYLIKEGYTSYNEDLWNQYVDSQEALAIEGAVPFVNWLVDQGIKVFFVTNRWEETKEATLENLKKIGIDFEGMADQSFFRAREGDYFPSDKYPRYRTIAQSHRIILVVGDNFSDFINTRGLDALDYHGIASQYKDWIGKRWIQIPNPIYGDWQKVRDLANSLPIWHKN